MFAFKKILKEDEMLKLGGLLKKLDVILDLKLHIREACDCSFLYWHRVRIKAFTFNSEYHNANL